MKKLLIVAVFLASNAFAGWDDAMVISMGNYMETSSVAVGTTTPVLLYTQDFWDVDVAIMSNSAYALWVGTNTTTLQTTGFPVLSSTTISMGGQYTGGVYGLADVSAAGSINVRVLRMKRNAR